MKLNFEEIEELLTRAKNYRASIPDDANPARREVAFSIDQLCEGIEHAVRFMKLPGSASVGEAEAWQWAGRVATAEQQLRHLLTTDTALEMAEDVGRKRNLYKESGARGGKIGGKLGGRNSKMPWRGEMQKAYDALLADHPPRKARAALVKALARERGVSDATARGWLREAGL